MSDPNMAVKLHFVHLEGDNDNPAVWGIAIRCLNQRYANYPF